MLNNGSPANNLIFLFKQPIFTVIIAVIIRLERLSLLKSLGILIAVAGITYKKKNEKINIIKGVLF